MSFTPKAYQSPEQYLADLEQRIAAAFAAGSRPVVTLRVPLPVTAQPSGIIGFDVPVTWPTPFADTAYTVVAVVEDVAPALPYGAYVRNIRSRSTSGCVVRINTSTGITAGQATLHLVAYPD